MSVFLAVILCTLRSNSLILTYSCLVFKSEYAVFSYPFLIRYIRVNPRSFPDSGLPRLGTMVIIHVYKSVHVIIRDETNLIPL